MGEEKPLEARFSDARGSYWRVQVDSPVRVSVSHRRTYASSDEAVESPDAGHVCGVCGSEHTRCIHYAVDAGTSCRLDTYAIVCLSCFKYTVYAYDW